LLCLEDRQSSESLRVLNDVKTNFQLLPDSTSLASDWSRVLSPLDAKLFSIPENDGDAKDNGEVDTTYHYDVDMVVIGISHPHCRWSDMCTFARDPTSFKLVFQQRRGTGNGFRGKFFESGKSRPLWTLPQALLAKAFFGNLEFDVVVFGPENVDKVGFEALITTRLCDSIRAARTDSQMPIHTRSSLNHLVTALVRNDNSSPSYTVSNLTAVSLILSNLQQRLSSTHHIIMVDLGCKSRSCSAGGAETKTRRSHSSFPAAVESSPNDGADWHDKFKEILANQLNLPAIDQHASFLVADFGIEFSADGRFMHWDQKACKSFKTAMGGKGSLFFSFGIRQLANFDSRNVEFER